MGAPPKNKNNVKSGVRMAKGLSTRRHGMTLSRLPDGCQYIHRRASELRNALEQEVVSQRDEITLPELAIVNTIATWTVHGLLCSRWLQKAGETLNHSERLAYSREVARAAAERERAIGRLGLEKPRDRDPWSILDAPPIASEATHEPPDGGCGGNGCQGGRKCQGDVDATEGNQ